MSIIGNAVTFGGGGGEPELLWTNPNPNGYFYSQTVTVSGDYAGYIVETILDVDLGTQNGRYYQTLVPNPLIIGTYTRFYLSDVQSGGGVPPFGAYRQINSMENGAFTFGEGYVFHYSDSSFTLDNTCCVPTRIWGVKWTL